jgi:NADPH2:quinone reductase
MRTSRGVIGFWLVHALQRPELMEQALEEMFVAVMAGDLEAIVGGTYPLSDARRAHEDIRSRATVGKLVIETKGS